MFREPINRAERFLTALLMSLGAVTLFAVVLCFILSRFFPDIAFFQ